MKYFCDYCEKPISRSEFPSILRYAEEDEDIIICPHCQRDLDTCQYFDKPVINYKPDKMI